MKDFDWEILYELHKNPNMTKVANLLYITQPSLTKRLKQMESEFQVDIVNRMPKGLEFTKEGEFLAKQAALYMEFMKETKVKLKEFKESTEGVISIGSSYTYSKYTLTDILVKYKQFHPYVQFNIINEQSNILFRKMVEDSIDVGFIRGDYEGPINRTLIERNKAYLVTKELIDIKELLSIQRITYKTNDRTLELLDKWWKDHFKTKPLQGMEVGYIDFAWQLIYKGLGYTCCFLPDNFENEYNLCITPLKYTDGTPVTRNTWFIYSKNKRITKVLEEFICFIEEYFSIEKI